MESSVSLFLGGIPQGVLILFLIQIRFNIQPFIVAHIFLIEFGPLERVFALAVISGKLF